MGETYKSKRWWRQSDLSKPSNPIFSQSQPTSHTHTHFHPFPLLSPPFSFSPHLVSFAWISPLNGPWCHPIPAYSMIPNHLHAHLQSNLSCADLVHSQYGRMACPTRPRGRSHGKRRRSTSNPLAVASLSPPLVRILVFLPCALPPRRVSRAIFSFYFFFFLVLPRAIRGTPKPVERFNHLGYGDVHSRRTR